MFLGGFSRAAMTVWAQKERQRCRESCGKAWQSTRPSLLHQGTSHRSQGPHAGQVRAAVVSVGVAGVVREVGAVEVLTAASRTSRCASPLVNEGSDGFQVLSSVLDIILAAHICSRCGIAVPWLFWAITIRECGLPDF